MPTSPALVRKVFATVSLLAGGVALGAPARIVVPMPATPVVATVPGTPAEVSARVEAWLAGTRPGFVDDKGERVSFDPQFFERPDLGLPVLRRFALDYNRDNKGQIDAFLLKPLAGGDTEPAPVRLYRGAAEVKDPAFDAYVALTPAARAHDLAVRSNLRNPAWTVAEYKGDKGQALPYYADYFVHFAPAPAPAPSSAPGGTVIQVIGYDARIEKGTEWGTRGGDGLEILPRRQPRLWMVRPSYSDKQFLLQALVRAATAR